MNEKNLIVATGAVVLGTAAVTYVSAVISTKLSFRKFQRKITLMEQAEAQRTVYNKEFDLIVSTIKVD